MHKCTRKIAALQLSSAFSCWAVLLLSYSTYNFLTTFLKKKVQYLVTSFKSAINLKHYPVIEKKSGTWCLAKLKLYVYMYIFQLLGVELCLHSFFTDLCQLEVLISVADMY